MWPFKKKIKCLFSIRKSSFKGDVPGKFEGKILEETPTHYKVESIYPKNLFLWIEKTDVELI